MNNKYGLQRILGEERSLLLLARAIDPKQANMMTEILKILSAICIVGEDNILDKLLEAISTAAEINNRERFAPIVEGLENDEALQLQHGCIPQPQITPLPPYTYLNHSELDSEERSNDPSFSCGPATLSSAP
ncbi:hypothetical protein AB205_0178210, partial [Aquarana catesbeiana]